MSTSTLDRIVPAVIFGSTLVGIVMVSTASDIESVVMGVSIVAMSILVCYFEFMRALERVNPGKID